MRIRSEQLGFSIVQAILAVAAVGIIGVAGVFVYQHNRAKPTSAATNAQAAPATNAASSEVATSPQTAAWNSYKDTGYAEAPGISLKYPSDWQLNIPGVKKVGNTKNPTATINERVIYLQSSESPKQEWETCAAAISGDACGAAPGDKTLNDREFTINGLAAYSATMQNDQGVYHVTVIQGKATKEGTPYIEYTTDTKDAAALSSFDSIMASATFAN